MATSFKALKLTDRVYWVGAIDWGLRNFHGYETSRGTSYNAYLVMGEKPALIDTVKGDFYDEMMSRIATVMNPADIRYVVSNHAEMDHSGGIPRFLKEFAPEKVFASTQGQLALDAHFGIGDRITAVKTDDRLELGGATLRFIETRMLHWPDSMFAYFEEDGVLFSNDAFGMHLASSERFTDELDPWIIRQECAKYYANILLHLSPIVQKLLEKLPSLNLDVKLIASDHGPIWRRDFDQILRWYGEWAGRKATNRAVVIYDTMWKSTAKMASAVGDGLVDGGAAVELMPLSGVHRSDVVTRLLDAGALLVGSPTMNNQIYPTVADVMNYLKGLKPKGLVGAAFGSFGWSGEAVSHLDGLMQEMGVELVQPGLRCKYVPDGAALAACHELGRSVAARLRQLIDPSTP